MAWLTVRPKEGQPVRVTPDELAHGYRDSGLPEGWIVEEVAFRLVRADRHRLAAAQRRHSRRRAASQPRGASAGCVFQNPPGDHAGRLIDSAGLKGHSAGGITVSRRHANFFLNRGHGTAADAWRLICEVQATVRRRFGIRLELEVEPMGAFTSA